MNTYIQKHPLRYFMDIHHLKCRYQHTMLSTVKYFFKLESSITFHTSKMHLKLQFRPKSIIYSKWYNHKNSMTIIPFNLLTRKENYSILRTKWCFWGIKDLQYIDLTYPFKWLMTNTMPIQLETKNWPKMWTIFQ